MQHELVDSLESTNGNPTPPMVSNQDGIRVATEESAGITEQPQAAVLPDPDRIGALDLIRGVAILGVLLANMVWFSGVTMDLDRTDDNSSPEPIAGKIVKTVIMLFGDGKFISQLAILFGVGLTLQLDRARAAGKRFTVGYLWRTFLLFLLGSFHAVFLWFGDILATYAIISVMAVVLVRLPRVWVFALIGAGLTWTAAWFAVGVALALTFGEGLGGMEKVPADAEATPSSVIESFSSAVYAEREDREKAWKDFGQEIGAFMGRHNQVRIYREGTYGEQLFDRAVKFLFFPVALIVFGGYLLACFLFGSVLVRSGFFTSVEVYRTWRPWLLGGGLILGIPLLVTELIFYLAGKKTAPLMQGPGMAGALAIAIVYLTLLTGWAQTRRLVWLQHSLKSVGRIALTNYLSHTIICTTIFYSIGFGLYATQPREWTMLVVLGVGVFQMVMSPLYLRYFRIGPVEWGWRSLASLRLQPILQRRTPVMA